MAQDDSRDGFGQSWWQDVIYAVRFRRMRRLPLVWQAADPGQSAYWDGHPLAGRFGDATVAVALHDGRVCIVRERIWHGWPDPPEFCLFVFEGERVWSAADFDSWPAKWIRTAASTL